MCADSFRNTHVINITFGQGEIPTSTKLQQGFAQARDANRLIEKAIGDLWNQGGSSAFENAGYRNYQANLARIFGSASVINPRVIYSAIPNYSDDISANEGLTDFYLKYAPDGGNLITVGASTALVLAQEKTSRAACQTAGDYYIDGAHLFCVTPLDNGGGAGVTVTYAANVPGDTDFAGADGATIGGIRNFSRPEYNVIPDPMTTNWGSGAVMVQITSAGAGLDYWLVDLPGMDGTAGLTTNRPSELSPVGGMPITTNYRLPTVLAGVGAGNQIPEGFIYLWDTATQSIVSGLTFSMTNPISTIQIHASPKQYLAEGNTRYALITVGLPLAVAFDNLRGLFHQHGHKRMIDDGGGQTWADGAELEHKDLSGLTTPAASTNYPTALEVPAFTLSRWDNDDHGQYLHRTGSYGQASGFRRDAQDNAMLGHLLLSAAAANPAGDWCNILGDSHRIYWGSVAAGPSMYYNKTDDVLEITGKNLQLDDNIEFIQGSKTSGNYLRHYYSGLNTLVSVPQGVMAWIPFATEYYFSSPPTGYHYLTPQSFKGDDSVAAPNWKLSYNSSNTKITLAGAITAVNRYAIAPVRITDGATVTALDFLGLTTSGGGGADTVYAELQRATVPAGDSYPSWTNMATCSITGDNGAGGPKWATTDTTITNSLVDNSNYMYRLVLYGKTNHINDILDAVIAKVTFTYPHVTSNNG